MKTRNIGIGISLALFIIVSFFIPSFGNDEDSSIIPEDKQSCEYFNDSLSINTTQIKSYVYSAGKTLELVYKLDESFGKSKASAIVKSNVLNYIYKWTPQDNKIIEISINKNFISIDVSIKGPTENRKVMESESLEIISVICETLELTIK